EVRSKAVEPHGLKWFNEKKEAKYSLKNWIDEGRLALKFPIIHDTVHEFELGDVFVKPEECNLNFVRGFYANWDTSFGERTK
ncbi:hypothetical protein HAX54_017667, partial [Datura stramonium]|nr:hypothetical protein [Datura stramonium]